MKITNAIFSTAAMLSLAISGCVSVTPESSLKPTELVNRSQYQEVLSIALEVNELNVLGSSEVDRLLADCAIDEPMADCLVTMDRFYNLLKEEANKRSY